MPKLLYARPAADEQEEAAIRKLAGSRNAPAVLVARAKTVLMSWGGARSSVIAAGLGCHMQTVRERLQRFNDEGVDGLFDRPGAGRKRRISEVERGRILALARSDPPGRFTRGEDGRLRAADEAGPPQWTLDTLTEAARAEGIEVHRSQVRRICQAEKVRWRHIRSWAASDDPDFAPKGRRSSRSTPTRRRAPRSSAPTSSAR
jgi:transposase